MCLNIGGAVLGIALSTLVFDSVASKRGGNNPHARLDGYRAGYYLCLGFCGLAMLLSFFMISLTVQSSRDPDATRSGTVVKATKKDEEQAAVQSNIAESGEIS